MYSTCCICVYPALLACIFVFFAYCSGPLFLASHTPLLLIFHHDRR